MRSVVLPQGLSDHHAHVHQDGWHHMEGLVVALVLIHVLAFIYWCYLLYASKKPLLRKKKTESYRDVKSAEWRTPKEVLAAYKKARLGKS